MYRVGCNGYFNVLVYTDVVTCPNNMVSRATSVSRGATNLQKSSICCFFLTKLKTFFNFAFLSVQVLGCQVLQTVVCASLCITFKIPLATVYIGG